MATASSRTPDSAIERDPTRGRWWIVVAAVLVQLALGAVYAWSVFNKPLQDQFGWSRAEAVLPAPVAKALLGGTDDKTSVFLPLGIAYLVAGVIGSLFFRNPPEGYRVPGWEPKAAGPAVAGTRVYTLSEALRTPQWYMLTAILTLNVTCGIAFISQAADAAQEVAGVSALTAATLVGVLGLFNGGGRVFWAWLSDRIGRMRAFLGMLALQAICFFILPHAAAFALFAILAALVYLAYGGGFGTTPATSSPPEVCASASSSSSSVATPSADRCGRTQSRLRRVPPLT